jgi:pyruvate dehydrogenase E2 component (dihydrolipoamide acetyltransferase)
MAKKKSSAPTAAPEATPAPVAVPPPAPVGAAPAPVAVPAPVVVPPVAVPAAVTTVKEPNQNGITRPTAGTTTRSVWEQANAITGAKSGNRQIAYDGTPGPQQAGIVPATRGEVVAACTAAGINQSTATTQYGKWAKFHGFVGATSPGRSATTVPGATPAPVQVPAAVAAPVAAPAPVAAAPNPFQVGYDSYAAACAGQAVGNPYQPGPDCDAFTAGWNQAAADQQAAQAAAQPAQG